MRSKVPRYWRAFSSSIIKCISPHSVIPMPAMATLRSGVSKCISEIIDPLTMAKQKIGEIGSLHKWRHSRKSSRSQPPHRGPRIVQNAARDTDRILVRIQDVTLEYEGLRHRWGLKRCEVALGISGTWHDKPSHVALPEPRCLTFHSPIWTFYYRA
jgi:hypothetical protein